MTTLTLTLTNPNASITLTGVNFSDNFPAGLQVANPAGIGSTCTGTWNATPGDTTLNFGGGTLTGGQTCTLTVNVTGTTAGVKNNATNAPQSNEGGTGVASNTATLTVIAPPTISKAFDATTIPLNGTSVLTFTITNPNSGTALSGIAFSDTLPAGQPLLTVVDPQQLWVTANIEETQVHRVQPGQPAATGIPGRQRQRRRLRDRSTLNGPRNGRWLGSDGKACGRGPTPRFRWRGCRRSARPAPRAIR